MAFSLLLYGFYFILRFSSLISSSFKKRLKEMNFTMVISAQKENIGRYLTFENGKIKSKRGDFENPNFSLVWANASVGFKIMLKGEPEAFMQAVTEGNLQMNGDAAIVMWFMETTNQMKGIYMKGADKE